MLDLLALSSHVQDLHLVCLQNFDDLLNLVQDVALALPCPCERECQFLPVLFDLNQFLPVYLLVFGNFDNLVDFVRLVEQLQVDQILHAESCRLLVDRFARHQ